MNKLYPDRKQVKAPDGHPGGYYFVRVSKEGIPVATFTDEACSQPADATTESITAGLRFFPALEEGKEVDGVAWVRLAQVGT